jgi:hypothetical protein
MHRVHVTFSGGSTMVLPQRLDADPVDYQYACSPVAAAAARYQQLKGIEAEHLALMARHNLLLEWTADVVATVTEARRRVQEARAAREAFRTHVREFVRRLRHSRGGLPAVLRQTRMLVQLLERDGVLIDDGGWLEAEVLEWAIEEFESAA